MVTDLNDEKPKMVGDGDMAPFSLLCSDKKLELNLKYSDKVIICMKDQ